MDKTKKILSKKVVVVTLAGVTLAATIPATPLKTVLKSFVVVNAEENATSEGSFSYSQLSNGTVEISKYIGSDTTVVIPSTIGGKKVTGIGVSAFSGKEAVESVTIPKGVTYIDNNAFNGCVSLKKVVIPDGVTTIGNYAFKGCQVLSDISIGSGLTWIGNSAFEDCIAVVTMTLPDGLSYIGEKGFYNCYSLLNFGVPDSVQYIGANAFATGNSNDKGIPWYSKLSGEIYLGNVFYSYKGTMPENTSVTIKDGTTAVAPSAFYNCTNLIKVEMPDSVTFVGDRAFKNCTGLKEVKLSNNLAEIGAETFQTCTSLESITLPESLTTIKDYAFRECTALKYINIPDAVHYISKNAFLESTNLNYMVFSEKCNFDSIIAQNFFDNNNLGVGLEGESSIKNVVITKAEGGTGLSGNPFGTSFTGTYLIQEGVDFSTDVFSDNAYAVFELLEDSGKVKLINKSQEQISNLPESIVIQSKEYERIKELTVYISGTPATCTSAGIKTIYTEDPNSLIYYEDEYGEVPADIFNPYFDWSLPMVDHHYVDGECEWCHKKLDTVSFAGNSITLDGDIVVKYYLELDDSVLNDEGAVIRFTTENGNVTEVKVQDAQTDTTTIAGKTCYVFECDMPAKEMNDKIEAKIVLSNGSESESYEYTVKDYADIIIENKDNNAEYEKAKELVKAMLVYGSYAQIYFGHNTDNLAYELSGSAEAAEIEAVSADDLKVYAESGLVIEDTDNVTLAGANLSLLSDTTLRLFFTIKDASNVKFLYGTEELAVKKSGSYSYIEISGIKADKLNETVTITVVDGGTSKTVQYNPMTYSYNVVNRGLSEVRTAELKNLIKALYNYNKKAIDYIK